MAPLHTLGQFEPSEPPAMSSEPTTLDTHLTAGGLLPQSAVASYTTTSPMTDVERAAGITAGHHLLHQLDIEPNEEADILATGTEVPNSIALRLYTSHFLSTWNSRLFEFGAALFLTSIFPGTLLPVSVYSLVRNAGYIIFAQPLGAWINKGNRLNIIRTSIVGQRVPVAASCALLLVLELKGSALGYRKDDGIFAVIVLLAVVEKLCSTMNTISVERDWVSGSEIHRRCHCANTYCSLWLSPREMNWPGEVSDLAYLALFCFGTKLTRPKAMNARMRRIDLFCKLMGPLTISLVAIASTKIAIYTTLGMNVVSVFIEYVFIEQVNIKL